MSKLKWPTSNKNNQQRADKIAQQIKVPDAKSKDQNFIPGCHMMEGENSLHNLSSELHMCAVACASPPK